MRDYSTLIHLKYNTSSKKLVNDMSKRWLALLKSFGLTLQQVRVKNLGKLEFLKPGNCGCPSRQA